ncbi:hypothetical protein [Pontixanthobacter aquaemixtae]|uniref:DUF883 domain-containing protein n=1 Tax=Pontixanthobacter aquaemixtae TaxID=1958940 RepID=A0A844ZQZ9_9SPHN|nr:hypothetical protein [Pontixanthobacter aquaemixtae]MXO90178.1 hypothetical protein [Pontixanthobacter aquaemixtae]
MTKATSGDEKRQALKAKIEAAEQRNADRSIGDIARDASKKATDFVKEHPFATLAGVAVLGLAIGAMTKPGRRAGKAAGENASKFASYAAELGMAYATGLIDAASDLTQLGKDKIEDLGDAINDNAGELKRKASFRGGNAAAAAKSLTREAGKKAGRTVRDLRLRSRP